MKSGASFGPRTPLDVSRQTSLRVTPMTTANPESTQQHATPQAQDLPSRPGAGGPKTEAGNENSRANSTRTDSPETAPSWNPMTKNLSTKNTSRSARSGNPPTPYSALSSSAS